MWDEERSKRSLVKWAGEEQDLDKTGNLRRAPTPFPKEMRAMAKKIENLRDKKKTESPTAAAIRKKVKVWKLSTLLSTRSKSVFYKSERFLCKL